MSIELKHVTRVYHANVDVRALDDVTVLELTDRAFRDRLLNIPLAHVHLTRTRDRRLAELSS